MNTSKEPAMKLGEMQRVPRWNPKHDGAGMVSMTEAIDGDFVRFSDFRDAQAKSLADERRIQELETVLRELTEQCEADFRSEATESGECPSEDDEAVAAGFDGDCAVTFGAIRRARAALRVETDK